MTAPNSVFYGSYLFAGVAASALITTISAFFAIPEYSHHYSELSGDGSRGALAGFGLAVFALLALLFAASSLLLAALTGRGMNPARVLLHLLGGLAICVQSGLLLGGSFAALPWFRTWLTIAAAVTVLFTAGSFVLLARPSAREFFRAVRLARRQRSLPTMMPPPGSPQPPANPWAHRG